MIVLLAIALVFAVEAAIDLRRRRKAAAAGNAQPSGPSAASRSTRPRWGWLAPIYALKGPSAGELAERRQLLDRPSEEELLHWVDSGSGWQLHGRLVPPADGHRRTTTTGGWCPARGNRPASGTASR